MNNLTVLNASLFETDGKWFCRLLVKQDGFNSTNIILFPKVSIPLQYLDLYQVQSSEGFEYLLFLPWNKLVTYKDNETGKKMFEAIVKKEPDGTCDTAAVKAAINSIFGLEAVMENGFVDSLLNKRDGVN